jgi:RNA recognition motif-containing protein
MTNIYVGNLPYDATEDDLLRSFRKYGNVSSVRVISDQGTGRAKGFAFVTMPRLEDAEEAIASLNGQDMSGRRIAVNEARDRPDRPARPPRSFDDFDDDPREVPDIFANF